MKKSKMKTNKMTSKKPKNEITNYSHPDESMIVLHEHEAAAKEYMNTKFSHLNCLCYEPSKLK